MRALQRLAETEERGFQIARRVDYLDRQARVSEASAGKAEQVLHEIDALIASLQLRKVSGDGQRAINSPDLDQPLVVRLSAGDRPLKNVPVRVEASHGGSEVESNVLTDAQGEAQTHVRRVRPAESSTEIVALVPLDRVTDGFPLGVRDKVARRRDQLNVRFSVLPAVYHHLDRMRELTREVESVRARADELLKQGQLLKALVPINRVLQASGQWFQVARQVDTLAPELKGSYPALGDANELRKQYEAILGALRLLKDSGDNQTAKPDRPLGEPLVVRVVAALPGREVALPDVLVRFGFETGNGIVESSAHTDAQGRAAAQVRRIEPGAASATVSARLPGDQLGSEILPDLRQRLEASLSAQVARFTITPPPKLEELKDGVIDWERKVIRVKGFGTANKSFPPHVWKKSAEEAAKVDAQAKLVEAVNGLAIESRTFVKNYQLALDEKVKEIKGRLKGATQVGPTRYATDDTAEVILELRLDVSTP